MAVLRFMERLLEHPTIYTATQAPFAEGKFALMERNLRQRNVRRVLDVGCGPGINATRFPGAEYVGVDINERYIEFARAKYRGRRFEQADLRTADLSSLGTFDTVIVNSLLHHVPDESVRRILRQLRDLLDPDGAVHMVELVWPERGSLVGIMAALDRGRYTRRVAAWRELFEEFFEPLSFEPHTAKAGLLVYLYFRGKAKLSAIGSGSVA